MPPESVFSDQGRSEIYAFVERAPVAQCASLAKKQRGAARHYLTKAAALSLPPMVAAHRETPERAVVAQAARWFATQYTDADFVLRPG